MPNDYLDKINLSGTTYDIKDTVSGYITSAEAPVTSVQGETGDVVLTAELSVAPSSYVGYGATDNTVTDDEPANTLIGSYTGTAMTAGPSAEDTNYTPRGEVTVTAPTLSLNYDYYEYKLYIHGVSVVTPSTAEFVGVPDKIVIDIQGEEET